MANKLVYQAYSAAYLDESIDFAKDAGQLQIENSASLQHSPLLSDRNMRQALIDDAKRLVENFTNNYAKTAGAGEEDESTAIAQLQEMMEYLVNENQHEALGVAPESLQKILEILKSKLLEARTDYDELDNQKEDFKELPVMKQHCQELQNEIDRLKSIE